MASPALFAFEFVEGSNITSSNALDEPSRQCILVLTCAVCILLHAFNVATIILYPLSRSWPHRDFYSTSTMDLLILDLIIRTHSAVSENAYLLS
ncbi:hypothetical protein K503DRAFT_448798 [Rhizopogon vinicolor AM-OR11-026]|uniref:Uncharacterized protein n=1 Tax=Rhizopogon vinicolor AM-OR11-026 TaxID=1314800 RepID=A0A1B7NHE7_9AGAM|nr:hypothetical protein K503DRAFT_448798 [Rhizopogon vinicolor AM-OR11-026]